MVIHEILVAQIVLIEGIQIVTTLKRYYLLFSESPLNNLFN